MKQYISTLWCLTLLISFSNAFNDHKFATGLYKQMVKDNTKSLIFSPMSVQTALSLVMFGAAGDTKQEMKTVMHYENSNDQDIQHKYNTLSAKVKASKDLKIANKIYVAQSRTIKQNFKDIAVNSFNSETQNVDFGKKKAAADLINKWVEDQTNKKIQDLVKPSSLEDVQMVLINAIYYKGAWQEEFYDNGNSNSSFITEGNSVVIPMMSQTEFFQYGENDQLDAKILQMGFEFSDISMMIILPNKKNGLSDLESKIDQVNFQDLAKSLQEEEIVVKIPKFKIESSIQMKDILQKLGMNKMFTDSAEFSELLDSGGNLSVSKVVHKAFIDVNQKGAEASAATTIYAVPISAKISYRKKYFNADHPFIFVLKSSTDTIFMGRFVGN